MNNFAKILAFAVLNEIGGNGGVGKGKGEAMSYRGKGKGEGMLVRGTSHTNFSQNQKEVFQTVKKTPFWN